MAAKVLSRSSNSASLQVVPTLAESDFKTAAIFDVIGKEIEQVGWQAYRIIESIVSTYIHV